MSKTNIILIAVIAVSLFVIFILSNNKTPEVSIPQGDIKELPPQLRNAISELNKEEYEGLSQKQIEEKFKQKGIRF